MKMKNVMLIPVAANAKVTAGANGAAVDVSGFMGDAKIVLDSTAGLGTTPTLDVKLQHSDDNITFVDVLGGAFTQVTDAGASYQVIMLSADGLKKWLRSVDAVTGTGPEFSRAVSLIGVKQYS